LKANIKIMLYCVFHHVCGVAEQVDLHGYLFLPKQA
jgi:hypothetical protein